MPHRREGDRIYPKAASVIIESKAEYRRHPVSICRNGLTQVHLSNRGHTRLRIISRHGTSRYLSDRDDTLPSVPGNFSHNNKAPPTREGPKVAVPTGFEPAISSLTGMYARPLHHGTMKSAPLNSVDDVEVYLAEPLGVNLSVVCSDPLNPAIPEPLTLRRPRFHTKVV